MIDSIGIAKYALQDLKSALKSGDGVQLMEQLMCMMESQTYISKEWHLDASKSLKIKKLTGKDYRWLMQVL